MGWFSRDYDPPEPGAHLEGLAAQLGSNEAAERLYRLDHKRELTDQEVAEYRDLSRKAGW